MGLVTAAAAAAYEHPLGSHSVREAYFLGRRNDDKLAAFLAQYVKRLPVPKSGPHVAEIEIRTPYKQVVLRASQAPDGYSAQQAEQDYRAQSEVIIVRVHISLTPTYPGYLVKNSEGAQAIQARPLDFWRDFSVRFIQEKEITPKRISGRPLFSARGSSGLMGADVELEFDVAQVTSAPVRVEVLTPDGHRADAEFDLGELR
jgi:hypothetical protein